MKILLMGHQIWACMVLKKLVEEGHEIVGVITEKDDYDDETYKANFQKYGCYMSLKDVALKMGLKVFQPDNVNSAEYMEIIENLSPDLIIIVSYHSIIKKPLIEKYKIINLHGSLLPKYRGRAPINWAIINGEKETGVTVHFVDEGIDTGDIIYQEKVKIEKTDTAIDVMKKTLPLYPKLASIAVNLIEKNEVKPIKQDKSDGFYFPRRKPQDGKIEWGWTTETIYNWIRALTHPYPGAFTFHKGKKLFVWKATIPSDKNKITHIPGIVIGYTNDGVRVTTGDSYIIINKVQLEGEKEVNALEYFKPGDIVGK